MAATTDKYEDLANQIEAILQGPETAELSLDAGLRRRIAEGARKLSIAFEEPGDTLRRIGYSHLELPLACIGVESGVFEALADGPNETFTKAMLAEKTKVNPKLLERLLRYFQSHSMMSQPEADGFKANNVTRILARHDHGSAIRFFHRVISPGTRQLPDFLRKHNYTDPTGLAPNAWNEGVQSDLGPFEWIVQRPALLEQFLSYMNIQREGRPAFFDVLNFEQRFGVGSDDSTTLFVDVGGAMGAQCAEFRKRYPALPGRVILQDLPTTVEKVRANPLPGFEGIEVEAYNFFTPQPIKGARAYYLRNVLHDWPEFKCVEILKNLKAGMTKDSVILIDETVLSEKGAPWRATQHDMEMLTVNAAQERTQAEWTELIQKAGLQMLEVQRYSEEYEDSLMILEATECAISL